uniref:mRNA interferase HigB n=1 Tax=Candidatus Kentrum sp. MB TaxID=2138164 RepID=A0A450X725_9GAMM|nr:MAG: mRNA interferase HigB [Candidatus Kentron sp. MB]VFK29871.1 MAG: mRNA interferase HigB [Candidatus Kentron sp. MB]VFK74978.1 MAG: mRNA interferase HigB [Candidatus Kentron sp. MB]
MHVISKRPFNEAIKTYPNHCQALEDLYKILSKGRFDSPDKMRRVFPSLDNFKYKDKWWVINVAGNHLRIIAFIQFICNRLYVKHILTHAEYDKLCNRYARGELK